MSRSYNFKRKNVRKRKSLRIKHNTKYKLLKLDDDLEIINSNLYDNELNYYRGYSKNSKSKVYSSVFDNAVNKDISVLINKLKHKGYKLEEFYVISERLFRTQHSLSIYSEIERIEKEQGFKLNNPFVIESINNQYYYIDNNDIFRKLNSLWDSVYRSMYTSYVRYYLHKTSNLQRNDHYIADENDYLTPKETEKLMLSVLGQQYTRVIKEVIKHNNRPSTFYNHIDKAEEVHLFIWSDVKIYQIWQLDNKQNKTFDSTIYKNRHSEYQHHPHYKKLIKQIKLEYSDKTENKIREIFAFTKDVLFYCLNDKRNIIYAIQ